MNKIEQFIEEKIKPELRPIFFNFRILLLQKFPLLREEMRGGTTDGKKMNDKFGLLEGLGNKSLNLRISSVKDYADEIMEYYITQAIEIDAIQ